MQQNRSTKGAHLKHSFSHLLQTENEQIRKLNDIVMSAVEEEKLISNRIRELEDINPPLAGRIADRVASFGGSWTFIVYFLIVMIFWICLNLYILSRPFDPYPFILLNLILSTLAALQAPIILMSQNRKEAKDRERATNDYLVNLKAEIEVRNLHHKMDLLISEQMKTLFEIQKIQMDLMEDIKAKLSE